MKHELKIWPQYYCRVANGTKTFEVRKNDRGFQPGDTVVLKEYDPTTFPEITDDSIRSIIGYRHNQVGYTKAPPLEFTIGYVYHLDAERVVFSLLKKEGL